MGEHPLASAAMKRVRALVLTCLVAASAVPVVVAAPSPVSAAATADVFCDERPATEPAADDPLESYEAINPQRLVDTRNGTGGVATAIDARCTLQLDVGSSVVPSDASAIALSLTAVADVAGFFTVYPCAAGRPETSNLNSRPGVATPNLVVAGLDGARTVCIYTNQRSHLVVDLAGWWGPGPDRFGSIEPVRVHDSREEPGGARLPAGHVRNVAVGGGPIPADATAAVVNLTVTDATNRGWFLAFPCGNPAPLASNLNFLADEARAVAAIVGLGTSGAASGQICVQSNRDVHFIIDVVGYYGPAPGFGPAASVRPAAGARLVDSRNGTGGWSTPLAAGEIRELDPVAGHPDAAEASAVLLNVVATNGAQRGHLRIYPCSAGLPTSSSLNFPAANSAANLVPVELSDDRTVCVYAHRRTDVVIDLFGVMTAPPGALVERLSFGSQQVWPPYSVDGTDHGIACGAGATTFEVEVAPLPGTTVRLDGVPVQPGLHEVSLQTDELLVVDVQRDVDSRRRHFRCLPDDFPDLRVERPGAPAAGWYLTTFGQGNSPQSGPYVVILDEFGAPVWYKRSDRPLVDAKLAADGAFSASPLGQFFGTVSDDLSRRVYGLDGGLLDDRRIDDSASPVALPVDHHDYVHLPGGGGAFVSYPLRTDVDLTALGAGYNADDSVVDGAIVETTAAGGITWVWNSADHFADDASTYPQRFGRYPSEPNLGEVDIVHINSIDRVDGGDYVVSARHFDTVFRVDRSSGDVEWTLGPVTSPGARQLTIVGDPLGGPRRQHDARLDGDVLTMFDNHTATAGAARAVAYRIDTDAGTATMLWERRQSAGLVSNALGSARPASDGSVLIDWGLPIQPMFEELDAAGERLLAIWQQPSGNSYRIVKYPAGTFDRDTLRGQAGGDLEVPPAP